MNTFESILYGMVAIGGTDVVSAELVASFCQFSFIHQEHFKPLVGDASLEHLAGKVEWWDTSHVTDMSINVFVTFSESSLFNEHFNRDLARWDTSNVRMMDYLFCGVTAFNQPIGNWNTSQVTSMIGMFINAKDFNQPLNGWDVSSVTTMDSMFRHATSFNQPLPSWNTSQVIHMEYMFCWTNAFRGTGLQYWNVSKVQSMQYMFACALVFNEPVDTWDVSEVIHSTGAFHQTTQFNQSLRTWQKWHNMKQLFLGIGASFQ